MTAAIGQILPLAIAVALSTVPIIAAILILLSDARPLVSVALLIGWAVGMALVLSVLTLAFVQLPGAPLPRMDAVTGWLRIAIGTALVGYAVVRWRARSGQAPSEPPRWMRSIGRITPWGALGFGVALALRPKNVILSIAGAVVIGDAALTVGDAAIVIAVFTAIGVSTVALPIIGHFSAPERTRTPLDAVRGWTIANSGAIMIVVAVLAGVVIIGSGIAEL